MILACYVGEVYLVVVVHIVEGGMGRTCALDDVLLRGDLQQSLCSTSSLPLSYTPKRIAYCAITAVWLKSINLKHSTNNDKHVAKL